MSADDEMRIENLKHWVEEAEADAAALAKAIEGIRGFASLRSVKSGLYPDMKALVEALAAHEARTKVKP